MIKNGSVSSASVQLTSSSLLQRQVRPSDEIIASMVSRERVKVNGSHGLTWLKSKGHSVSKGSHAHSEVRSLSTVIASPLKIRVFSQRLIRLSSFHSLSGILGSPLLSLSSSRVILIFDKNPKFWNPKKIPRKYQKNIQNGHFWYLGGGSFLGIFGVFWG